MTGILRFLTLLLLALLARLFLARWLRPRTGPSRPPRPQSPPKAIGSMHKDPQCGTYVAPELAVTAAGSGKTLHFCSERCRDLYLNSLQ